MLRIVALAAWLLAGGLPTAAQEVEANIVTGGPAGTYIQIGRDLAALGAECGLTLNVQESAGSIENMNAVRDKLKTCVPGSRTSGIGPFAFSMGPPSTSSVASGGRTMIVA